MNLFSVRLNRQACSVAELNDNARLLAAAYTSYDKHFGPGAVEAAEADLLGEALQIIRDMTGNSERRQEEAKIRARDLLAKTKGD